MIFQLDLKDIEPKDSFKESYENKINNLLDVAPSDSCASTKIVKKKDGYFGVLQIFSSQGKFNVQSTCDRLDDLVRDLTTQMHSHIKNWRKYRFLSDKDSVQLA